MKTLTKTAAGCVVAGLACATGLWARSAAPAPMQQSTRTVAATPQNPAPPDQQARVARPVLSYFRNFTTEPAVPIFGFAAGASSVRITAPTGEFTGTVAPDGRFSVDVDLLSGQVNRLFIFANRPGSRESAPTFTEITRDNDAPFLFIDSQSDGDVVFTDTIDVFGRVGDVLAGELPLRVTVNDQQAIVFGGLGSNGTFALDGLAIPQLGPFDITIAGSDALGNRLEVVTSIERAMSSQEAISIVSGSGQTAEANSVLPAPIVVRILDDAGAPFPGKLVCFAVKRSDGLLGGTASDCTKRKLQVRTNANGEAAAYWLLGSDAGCSNNRVVATSTSIDGQATFVASANPTQNLQLNLGSGTNQRVQAGGVAPLPLRVWLNDSCNPVGGRDVLFTVTKGAGKIQPGAMTAVVTTDDTGHAEVFFEGGMLPEVCVVTAAPVGMPTSSVGFVLQVIESNLAMPTSFQALVVDNAQSPLVGAACRMVVDGVERATGVTSNGGTIEFPDLGAFGEADFYVDGGTVTEIATPSGPMMPDVTFPKLHFDFEIIPGAMNTVGMPIILPPLRTENAAAYSVVDDVLLSVAGIDGLEFRVKAGSMTIDGQPAPNGTPLSLNQVHHDDIPMPMPDGVAPLFAWTLQPGGAHFDPPVEVTYPNMAGLPPGAVAYFLSFDHDLGRFAIVASGNVSEDGSVVRTAEGEGLTVAGWGCNCPPYSVTSECVTCETDCFIEGSLSGGTVSASNDMPVAGEMVTFTLSGVTVQDGVKRTVCSDGSLSFSNTVPTADISWVLTDPTGATTSGLGPVTAPIEMLWCGEYRAEFKGRALGECASDSLESLGSKSVEFSPDGSPLDWTTIIEVNFTGFDGLGARIADLISIGSPASCNSPSLPTVSFAYEYRDQCCPDGMGGTTMGRVERVRLNDLSFPTPFGFCIERRNIPLFPMLGITMDLFGSIEATFGLNPGSFTSGCGPDWSNITVCFGAEADVEVELRATFKLLLGLVGGSLGVVGEVGSQDFGVCFDPNTRGASFTGNICGDLDGVVSVFVLSDFFRLEETFDLLEGCVF